MTNRFVTNEFSKNCASVKIQQTVWLLSAKPTVGTETTAARDSTDSCRQKLHVVVICQRSWTSVASEFNRIKRFIQLASGTIFPGSPLLSSRLIRNSQIYARRKRHVLDNGVPAGSLWLHVRAIFPGDLSIISETRVYLQIAHTRALIASYRAAHVSLNHNRERGGGDYNDPDVPNH